MAIPSFMGGCDIRFVALSAMFFFRRLSDGLLHGSRFLQVITNDNLTLSAVLMMLPMIFGFWAASLTIASWYLSVEIALFREGENVPLFDWVFYALGAVAAGHRSCTRPSRRAVTTQSRA